MRIKFRFESLSPSSARLLLILAGLCAILTGFMAPQNIAGASGGQALEAQTTPRASANLGMSDLELYRAIAADVGAGESYYSSAVRHQRAESFPVIPFVSVRLPVLASVTAALGTTGTQAAIAALAAATGVIWFLALARLLPLSRVGLYSASLIAGSSLMLCAPDIAGFHESWAALLIALSLAIWPWARARSSGALMALCMAGGLAAALFRELAVAYLVLMAVAALFDKRWLEALGWSTAVGLVAVAMLAHAQAIAALLQPGDLASQGWHGLGGWPFYVATARQSSLFNMLPVALGQALVPVCLLGWLSWNSPLALRVSGVLVGYGLMLMLFARPEQLYWSLLTAPLLAGGLALAPSALMRLVALARSNQVASAFPPQPLPQGHN